MSKSRYTVGNLINDAYLSLDGDNAPVAEGTIAYNTGLRLLNRVAGEVLTYRNWSFLRQYIPSCVGNTDIEPDYEVIRVMDALGRVFHRVYYPTPRRGEYNIIGDMLVTGPGLISDCGITIEVMPYFSDFSKAKEEIHPKLYDVLVLGLTSQLASIDDGYRMTAQEREAEYKDRLDIAAKRDMRQAGDGVLF